ncbi:flavodoxin [Deltaproteobacteria bacterium]|nr:flavodoxin [Deltaproteobacteria bacterium]
MTTILACSPRAGGNCDAAARIVRDAGGEDCSPVRFLREYRILPCTSCGDCEEHPGQCSLREEDDSLSLFSLLRGATRLVIVAPIYFYHLPAQLKAVMDRSQMFWEREGACMQKFAPNAQAVSRKAHIILIGGRSSGVKLFAGSLLSLRYWLPLLGYGMALPLTLYGLDEPDALLQNREQREALARYARERVFA